jgi:hypothetical protein
MTAPRSTEAVIDALVRDARPVARLRPPMTRACGWLALIVASEGAIIAAFADLDTAREHARAAAWLIEMAGTLATGCLAVIAAFHLSLPDRSRRWALLPLPAFAVWLLGSGAGCWEDWLRVGKSGSLEIGESMDCLAFILGVGIPLGAVLFWSLRRARPLSPLPVALTGALGAAAFAAFLLQFFHPFQVTVMDLTIHLLAVGVVVAAWGLGGRRVLN